MLACLLQINAFAGAIERDFALLPAALRTDSSVDCRTEALFFAFVADDAGQIGIPGFHYGMGSRGGLNASLAKASCDRRTLRLRSGQAHEGGSAYTVGVEFILKQPGRRRLFEAGMIGT